MCGIVCYFGQARGISTVLEALHLLEYRAPDSSGLAVLNEEGHWAVRRAVGFPRNLIEKLAAEPLLGTRAGDGNQVSLFMQKQGLAKHVPHLRDCSASKDFRIEHIFQPGKLSIGIGDRGAMGFSPTEQVEMDVDKHIEQVLNESGATFSPDFDQDPVRYAFRLVAANVVCQAGLDHDLANLLDERLLASVPEGSYANWRQAWEEELTFNIPGYAFTIATKHFQETFPGLIELLDEQEMGRVGGLTSQAMVQIVMGHGRWAMVGSVSEMNAHPLLDHSGTRVVCENGSHNTRLMLQARAEQETWWHRRGIPLDKPVHRSENTTEVIAYEWEKAYHQIIEGSIGTQDEDKRVERQFMDQLLSWGIDEPEDQALRFALSRLSSGNAHACAFMSQRIPGNLFISSHDKPVAIVTKATGDAPQEVMAVSDVNAALALWSSQEVEQAAARIQELAHANEGNAITEKESREEIRNILDRFSVEVIFLDRELYGGKQLLARIQHVIEEGQVKPLVEVTRYDGTPVAVAAKKMQLNPAMVGKRSFPTYIEAHIDEIPGILDDIVRAYVKNGEINLESIWSQGTWYSPGLHMKNLEQHFGKNLERVKRVLLVGEGSSWCDAQAAAPLFRELLPGVVVNVYRPIELINLGEAVDPQGDLAIEISWSGTTDSLLKVDSWLAESGVVCIGITGKPQSDLGRRTASSAGTLDVLSGVEVSVATVKGFMAILMTLNLLAFQLFWITAGGQLGEKMARMFGELTLVVPEHVRGLIQDQKRRQAIRVQAERAKGFNKVAVIGSSPIDFEGELKIEELAQIVAGAFDFSSTSLRSLIERSAIVEEDRERTLFIINATSPDRLWEARAIIHYMNALGVFCIVHTNPHVEVASWHSSPTVAVITSPKVSDLLQPLIDTTFFYDLAVALAYARGLSPEEIDRPRNLAKSVTTTGSERRVEIEARQELIQVTLDEFGSRYLDGAAWDDEEAQPTPAALLASVALRGALAMISEPIPGWLELDRLKHLIVLTDSEATENAAHMAKAVWNDLLGVDMTVYRRFIAEAPQVKPDTIQLDLILAGSVLVERMENKISLPADLSPLQSELLGAVYFSSLAVRSARELGKNTNLWEASLAQLPLVVAELYASSSLVQAIGSALSPLVASGYDKAQVVGGGQDFSAASSIARSLRSHGFMAEALYVDSSWHGPLATVGGQDAEHDNLMIILACDPLFQAAALVDTQVYRTRNAPVLLVVPRGSENMPAVKGVNTTAVFKVPAVPAPFTPVVNAALGDVFAKEMNRLWEATRLEQGGTGLK